MAYGTLKADTIIYDDSGDQTLSLAALGSIDDKAPKASPTFTGTVEISPNIANVETAITGKQATATDLTALSSCQTGAATALALLTATEVGVLDGVTATTAEVNLLDGVTSTTAELNILDGVTSTAAELNILDGVTSTAAELNLLDGKTAVGDALLDGDQTWTGAQSGSIYDATSDATSAGAGWYIDFDDGNNQKVTLNSTNLLSVQPTHQTVGQSGSIFITQPGSPLSLGWHGDWKWAGGTAPSLTQTGGATDRLDYVILAANTIHAVLTLAVA